MSGEARAALELLAVWEQLGLADLESFVGAGPVEELDRAGLLDVTVDRRRQQVRLAHPLYGEVIRGGLPVLTTRRLLLEGADRIEAHGARRRSDRLQIAVARVDAAGTADPELLLAAARVARQAYDHRLLERSRGWRIGLSCPPSWSSSGQRRCMSSANSMRSNACSPKRSADDDPRSAVQLVALRVRNLMWGLQRPADALAVNREAREELIDEADRDELVTDEALTLLHSNRPDEALLALSRCRRTNGAVGRAALHRRDPCAHRDRALRTGADARRRRVRRPQLARGSYRHRASGHPRRVQGPGAAGSRTHRRSARSLRGAGPNGRGAVDRRSGGRGSCWVSDGPLSSPDGPARPQKWLAEGVLMSMGTAFDGPHRVQLSLLAVAQSWLGDLDGATATIAELDATPRSAFSEAEDDVGRAWTAVAAGNPLEAKEVLAQAAARAEAAGQRAVEARLLHDLLRIGDVASAAPRLAALASVCEGPLVAAFRAHAQAVSDGDGAALDAVSRRFETLGLMLVAAEASNAAGDAHRRAQDQRAANSSLAASKLLAMRCEGASTPG